MKERWTLPGVAFLLAISAVAVTAQPPAIGVVLYGNVFLKNGTSADGAIYDVLVYDNDGLTLLSNRTGIVGSLVAGKIYESQNKPNSAGDIINVTVKHGNEVGRWSHVITQEERGRTVVEMPDMILDYGTTSTTTVPTPTTTTTVPTTTTSTTVSTTTVTVSTTTTPLSIQGMGSIIITSSPTGADVLFDSIPIGQTPITKSDLPVGIGHSIVVSKPGYYKKERIASATTDGTQVYVELNKISEGRPVPHLTISQTGIKTLLNVGEESLLQYGIFNDGDADALDIKILMEVPSGVTASFVSEASKAGRLVTWTGDKIKAGATESPTVRIKSEQEGKGFIPLHVSYKDDSGNKYSDDMSLSIETAPALTVEKDSDDDGWSDEREIKVGTDPYKSDTDGDGYLDPKDPAPLDPTKPESENPLKNICGPTALLGISLLPLISLRLLKRRG